jgi:ATP-dependent helicase/DNAse subunit B
VNWQRDRTALERTLLVYLRRERARSEEGWAPIGNERGFARVEIDLGERKLSFRGAIDRLDRNGEELRVVDYKTGWPSETGDGYRKGESLQLPLYIHAASASEGVPVESIAAEYHFVGPRGLGKTVGLNGSDLAADDRFGDMLRSMLAGIDGGRFFTWPGTRQFNGNTNCTYCDYKTVCHGSVGNHTDRKQSGSQQLMRSWLDMREER